jgi:thiamine-phosphate pyrophosphorylase
MKPDIDYTLYLVTGQPPALGCDLLDVVAAAVAGGVSVVQLREKHATTAEFIALGRALKTLLDPLGVPLLINDRVDVALAVSASGAHLGRQDMDYPTARRLLGPDAIIGLTVNSIEDLIACEGYDADYLGVGPIYPTSTKENQAPPWGVVGFARASAMSRHKLVGIGGITAQSAADLASVGAAGVAVVSAIIKADWPREAAKNIRSAMDEGRRLAAQRNEIEFSLQNP